MNALKRICVKLITKEDAWHVHKMLGVTCLLSFIYRYCIVWPRVGTLGIDGGNWSCLAVFLHTTLSFTALQFRVPHKRIASQPTMIWEEYRQHAFLFTLRCFVAYYSGLLLSHKATPINVITRYCSTMSIHYAVDYISLKHGTPSNTTVRGDHTKAKSLRTQFLCWAYALYQMLALASHLWPLSGPDMGYNTFITIQLSAFAMTLNRKGLITWRGHAVSYVLVVVLSSVYIVQHLWSWQFGALVVLAAITRLWLCKSKYLTWLYFSLGAYCACRSAGA